MSQLPCLTRVFGRERNASANVLGILETDQTRDGMMYILRSNGNEDVIEEQSSIFLVRNGTGLDTTQSGHPTCFIQIDVGLITNNDFISSLAVNKQGNQIAHRPRGNKDRSFFSQHFRGQILQLIDRRIITVYVVAN